MFRNRFITFSEVPTWHDLEHESLRSKVGSAKSADWGGTTNIQACLHLILESCVTNNMPEADLPSAMVIFSDMQFDDCNREGGRLVWESTYVHLEKVFVEAGYSKPAHVVFWNLRGCTARRSQRAQT